MNKNYKLNKTTNIIFYSILCFLLSSSASFSKNWVNPDNPLWTTIDSMEYIKVDNDFYSRPYVLKVHKIDNSRWLSLSQSDPNTPTFFVLKYTSDAGQTWKNLIVDTNSVNPHIIRNRRVINNIGEKIIFACDSNYIQIMENINSPITDILVNYVLNNYFVNLLYKDGVLLTMHLGQYFKSTDEGKSWVDMPIKYGNDFYGVQHLAMESSKKYFAGTTLNLGSDYYYFLTENAGESWEKLYKYTSNSDSLIQYFNFIDENIGYGIVNTQIAKYSYYFKTKLNKTTDGGRTWFNVYTDPDSTFLPAYDIEFNKSNNIAFHSYNTIYYLENDKLIFKTKLKFNGKEIMSEVINDLFLTDNNEIIVAKENRIFKYSPVSSVEQNNEIFFIKPNPAGDYIEIINNSQTNNLFNQQYEIYNSLGDKIIENKFLNNSDTENTNLKIDISQFIIGVYFIKINNQFYKFIKI